VFSNIFQPSGPSAELNYQEKVAAKARRRRAVRALLSVLLMLLMSVLPASSPTSAQTSTRRLPPAGFGLNIQQNVGASGLPKVSGVHLGDTGEDRPDNSPPEVYNPGEPSARMALVRWESNKMPLKIWISPGLKLPECPFDQIQATRVDTVVQLLNQPTPLAGLQQAQGWTEHTNDVVAAGIEEWRQFENEGLFSFVFCDDPRAADIVVFFPEAFRDASSPGGIMIGGVTSATVYPIQQAHSMRIRQKPVVIELSLAVNYTDDRLYGAAAHEFGHALGIKAHSDKRQDIMFRDRIVNHLSPSDKATIRWLYHQKPAYVM
jgi:predicted Zn-dependent protease